MYHYNYFFLLTFYCYGIDYLFHLDFWMYVMTRDDQQSHWSAEPTSLYRCDAEPFKLAQFSDITNLSRLGRQRQ